MTNNYVRRPGLVAGVFALLSLVFVLVSTPTDAEACSCMAPGTPSEEAPKYELIVIASVEAVQKDDMQLRATVKVERWLKGETEATVEIQTGGNSAMCGFNLEKGRRYLLYVNRSEEALRVSLCSASTLADNATAEIEELAALGLTGDDRPQLDNLDVRQNPPGPKPMVSPPPANPPAQKKGCGCQSAPGRESLAGLFLVCLAFFSARRRVQ